MKKFLSVKKIIAMVAAVTTLATATASYVYADTELTGSYVVSGITQTNAVKDASGQVSITATYKEQKSLDAPDKYDLGYGKITAKATYSALDFGKKPNSTDPKYTSITSIIEADQSAAVTNGTEDITSTSTEHVATITPTNGNDITVTVTGTWTPEYSG